MARRLDGRGTQVGQLLRDSDIRAVLGGRLRSEMGVTARVVEELGLCQGDVFVDVAVVDSALDGYEIKSDLDSLRRLERQRVAYSKVLFNASIVVTQKHLTDARQSVPRWWGILLARPRGTSVEIAPVRKPKRNPSVDPAALVQLLWRDEALQLLEDMGVATGLRGMPRRAIWARLQESLTLGELQAVVCAQLKLRGDWRSATTRIPSDDLYRRRPRSSGCRDQFAS